MEMQAVNSSWIKEIGYDFENGTLVIEFNSGSTWQYFEIPESLWYEFEGAESHGKFFHANILKQYTENQIS